jgi:hypothetical protein
LGKIRESSQDLLQLASGKQYILEFEARDKLEAHKAECREQLYEQKLRAKNQRIELLQRQVAMLKNRLRLHKIGFGDIEQLEVQQKPPWVEREEIRKQGEKKLKELLADLDRRRKESLEIKLKLEQAEASMKMASQSFGERLDFELISLKYSAQSSEEVSCKLKSFRADFL